MINMEDTAVKHKILAFLMIVFVLFGIVLFAGGIARAYANAQNGNETVAMTEIVE